MHLWDNDPTDNVLDQAIHALVSEPIEQHAIDRVAERALQLNSIEETAAPSIQIANPTKSTTAKNQSWVRLTSLAASITIAILGSIWYLNHAPGRAFAQVIERLQKITAVRFETHIQFGTSDAQTGVMSIDKDSIRLEQMDGQFVLIGNATSKKAIVLDTVNKKSQSLASNDVLSVSMINPIEQLMAIRNKSVRSLGNDRIDGRRVEVFQIGDVELLGMKGIGNMILWVDAETQLPAKIMIRDSDPKHKQLFEFDHFDWSPSIDPATMATTTPSGFSDGVVMLDAQRHESDSSSKTAQQDLRNGILSSDRVPGHIEVSRTGDRVTAILRDAESLSITQRKPNEIRQWELSTGKVLWKATVGGASTFALSKNSDRLALVEGQEIQIRDASTAKVIERWESPHNLGSVALSVDGKWLAHGFGEWAGKNRSTSGGIEVWDLDSKSLVRTMDHGSPVEMVQFAPDGNTIVSAGGSSIKVWKTETGALEWNIDGRMRIAFNANGKQLAYISNEPCNDPSTGRVDIINVESRQRVQTLISNPGAGNSFLLSLCFASDDSILAASDWNGTITAWELSTGKMIDEVESEKQGVHCVRFTSNHQWVSGSEDGHLRLREFKNR